MIFCCQAQEIGHLIACQPVALKAVRLQALLPHCPEKKSRPDDLSKSEVSAKFRFDPVTHFATL